MPKSYLPLKPHSLLHRFNILPWQRGMTGIEFLIIAIPTLLIGLSAYETSRWYNTKHAVNLALIEAARHAAVSHAHPDNIEASFEKALTPIFATKGRYSSPATRRDAYLNKVQTNIQASPWKIHIKSPRYEHFVDFYRQDLDIALQTGRRAIDNNYQKEQNERKGTGLLSNENIFEANTLQLSLVYPYQPIVPGISFLFKQLSSTSTVSSPSTAQSFTVSTPTEYLQHYSQQLLKHGYLPIRQTVSISMQSHPVAWTTHSKDKVIGLHLNNDSFTSNHGLAQLAPQQCLGIWCSSKALNPYSSELPNITIPNNLSNTLPSNSNSSADNHTLPTEQATDYKESLPSSQEQHPLCGISLCCG